MNKRKRLIIITSAVVMFGIAVAVGYFWGFQRGVRAGHLTAGLAEFTLANQHMPTQWQTPTVLR